MALISRSDAAALIDIEQSGMIWKEAENSSLALRTFEKRNMGTSQTRMRLLETLPSAGFVGNQGDGGAAGAGRKPTSNVVWANKTMQAEEIAVIVPIPENVLADAEFDIWAEVRPLIAQAIGNTLDQAVFFGNVANYPASWPTAIAPAAIAAGNVVSRAASEGRLIGPGTAVVSTNVITTAAHGLVVGNAVVLSGGGTVTGFTAGTTYYVLTVPNATTLTLSATPGGAVLDLTGADGSVGTVAQVGLNGMPVVAGYDAAFSIEQTMSAVENDGYVPDAVWTDLRFNQAFRSMRDANGQRLFVPALTVTSATDPRGTIHGMDVYTSRSSAWPTGAGTTQAIVGDSSKAILGIRQDIEYKLLTEATLTDGAGAIVYALAEQDMVALRVKFRVGFQVADPTTDRGGSSAYPFAALTN